MNENLIGFGHTFMVVLYILNVCNSLQCLTQCLAPCQLQLPDKDKWLWKQMKFDEFTVLVVVDNVVVQHSPAYILGTAAFWCLRVEEGVD